MESLRVLPGHLHRGPKHLAAARLSRLYLSVGVCLSVSVSVCCSVYQCVSGGVQLEVIQ